MHSFGRKGDSRKKAQEAQEVEGGRNKAFLLGVTVN
jgi:hypothetical protein